MKSSIIDTRPSNLCFTRENYKQVDTNIRQIHGNGSRVSLNLSCRSLILSNLICENDVSNVKQIYSVNVIFEKPPHNGDVFTLEYTQKTDIKMYVSSKVVSFTNCNLDITLSDDVTNVNVVNCTGVIHGGANVIEYASNSSTVKFDYVPSRVFVINKSVIENITIKTSHLVLTECEIKNTTIESDKAIISNCQLSNVSINSKYVKNKKCTGDANIITISYEASETCIGATADNYKLHRCEFAMPDSCVEVYVQECKITWPNVFKKLSVLKNTDNEFVAVNSISPKMFLVRCEIKDQVVNYSQLTLKDCRLQNCNFVANDEAKLNIHDSFVKNVTIYNSAYTFLSNMVLRCIRFVNCKDIVISGCTVTKCTKFSSHNNVIFDHSIIDACEFEIIVQKLEITESMISNSNIRVDTAQLVYTTSESKCSSIRGRIKTINCVNSASIPHIN